MYPAAKNQMLLHVQGRWREWKWQTLHNYWRKCNSSYHKPCSKIIKYCAQLRFKFLGFWIYMLWLTEYLYSWLVGHSQCKYSWARFKLAQGLVTALTVAAAWAEHAAELIIKFGQSSVTRGPAWLCPRYVHGNCSQQGAGIPQKGADEREVQSRVWIWLEHKGIT